MFYIEVNNKKMQCSNGKIYEYNNYTDTRNTKDNCYGNSYNNVKLIYENNNNRVEDIETLLLNILHNYNTNKNIKLPKLVTITNNEIYIDSNKIGRLQQSKNNKWIIFDM